MPANNRPSSPAKRGAKGIARITPPLAKRSGIAEPEATPGLITAPRIDIPLTYFLVVTGVNPPLSQPSFLSLIQRLSQAG